MLKPSLDFPRFVVTNTSHQKKWALYRAFPIYSSRTREVHGMEVPPRFASVYAGVENWLHGIRIDDVDIGEDAVQAYSEDVRKLRVTVECERGELFVSAPYTDVVDATFDGHPAGRSQLIEGEAVRDNIAGANAGDVQFGTSASVPMGSNLRNMLGAWLCYKFLLLLLLLLLLPFHMDTPPVLPVCLIHGLWGKSSLRPKP